MRDLRDPAWFFDKAPLEVTSKPLGYDPRLRRTDALDIRVVREIVPIDPHYLRLTE